MLSLALLYTAMYYILNWRDVVDHIAYLETYFILVRYYQRLSIDLPTNVSSNHTIDMVQVTWLVHGLTD